MESKPTRISEYSLKHIREIAKDIGNPSDDTAIRHLISEYYRLMEKVEKLELKLKECEQRKNKK
jgi:hypothetical protein